jgi:predicted membrane-bound spermidine synthase
VDYFKTAGTIFNNKSYDDPRLTVIHEEALQWLKSTTDKFDAIFIDLLDPNESTLSFLKELLCECKKHLSPRDSGLSINAGMIQMYNNDAPACALASYMRTLFNDPNYSRAAIHVDVPSFLGSWGFLQIASPSWSRHIHDTKLPENITYCKKEVILNGTRWPTSYPLELQNFWMTTDTDSTVKLTDYFNPITGKVEHYGC